MKTLYCDIDSTINNHRERIKRNTVGGWPGTIIDPKAFTHDEVMKDLPIPEALEALNKLSETYSINFLTSRDWDYPNGNTTKEWLDLHGFPYDSINIVRNHGEKADFLNVRHFDAYIDDFMVYQEQLDLKYLKDLKELIDKRSKGKVFKYEDNWEQIYESLT